MSYEQTKGHGEKRSRKMEAAILALLSEPTLDAAAKKSGVSISSLKRWQKRPDFQASFEKARRELAQGAVTQLQSSMTLAAKTLTDVMTNGSKDGDRIRAAAAVLQYGFRGVELADTLQPPEPGPALAVPRGLEDLVNLLADQMRQVSQSHLGTETKALLTSKLTNDILRAIDVGVLQKNIEAVELRVNKSPEGSP